MTYKDKGSYEPSPPCTRYLETRTQTHQHTSLFTIENRAVQTRQISAIHWCSMVNLGVRWLFFWAPGQFPQVRGISKLEPKHISTLFYSPLKVQLQKLVKSQYGAPHSFSTVNICREVCWYCGVLVSAAAFSMVNREVCWYVWVLVRCTAFLFDGEYI